MFGVDPDNGSGALEVAISVGLLASRRCRSYLACRDTSVLEFVLAESNLR